MPNNLNDKAEILMETLPFMRRYSNKVIVIKFGGHAMGKKEYVKTFAQDVSLLQVNISNSSPWWWSPNWRDAKKTKNRK